MPRIIVRARYEDGVLKPLEPIELREGEEVQLIVVRSRVSDRLYGAAKRRRPGLTREDLLRVIEEIEDEGFRRL